MTTQFKKEGDAHELGDKYIIDPWDRHFRAEGTRMPAKPFVGTVVRHTSTQAIISEDGGDRTVSIRLDDLYGTYVRPMKKPNDVEAKWVYRYSDEKWSELMGEHDERVKLVEANRGKADERQAQIDHGLGIKDGYPESAVKVLRKLGAEKQRAGHDLQAIIRALQSNDLYHQSQHDPQVYSYTAVKAEAAMERIIDFLDGKSDEDASDVDELIQTMANETARSIIFHADRPRDFNENHARKIVLVALADKIEVTCPVW